MKTARILVCLVALPVFGCATKVQTELSESDISLEVTSDARKVFKASVETRVQFLDSTPSSILASTTSSSSAYVALIVNPFSVDNGRNIVEFERAARGSNLRATSFVVKPFEKPDDLFSISPITLTSDSFPLLIYLRKDAVFAAKYNLLTSQKINEFLNACDATAR